MTNPIDFFESVVGPSNVIKDEQKTTWGADHSKVYQSSPLVAVLPQSTEEVQKILRYCNKNKIAVGPSGGYILEEGAKSNRDGAINSNRRWSCSALGR